MLFNHKGQQLLSIPMGISMGIHALLATGLIFLSWEKPAPKPAMPPIKITHIKLDQKKATTSKETTKPVRGNPEALKASQSFQPTPHHARTVSRKTSIPVKPITPAVNNINTIFQKQPVTMVSSSVQAFPVSVRQSQNSQLIDFSPTQSTSIQTTHRALTISAHTARPTLPSKNELGKSLIRVASKISSFSGRSYSSPTYNKEARSITDELNSTPLKASPVPGLQLVERWIPVSTTHPVQVASIPSDFVDENSESTSLESVAEKLGHPAGETNSSGQDLEAIRKGFSSSVWGKITQAKYYPSLARKRGWEGKPIVEFKLARNGDLLSSAITLTSPYKILNEAALNAVKNAVPYPQIPEMLKVDSIRFKLPISFILDQP